MSFQKQMTTPAANTGNNRSICPKNWSMPVVTHTRFAVQQAKANGVTARPQRTHPCNRYSRIGIFNVAQINGNNNQITYQYGNGGKFLVGVFDGFTLDQATPFTIPLPRYFSMPSAVGQQPT